MIELGQLEAEQDKFAKRKTRLLVASIEDQATAQQTQADFPHLVVIADKERKLAEAFDLVHPASAPDGGDTAAPLTVLVDGAGQIRWTFRSDNVFRRLSPEEVLAAVDEHLGKR